MPEDDSLRLKLAEVVKAEDSSFIRANEYWLQISSFESVDKIAGLNDYDCPWSEYASLYEQHDKNALKGDVYTAIHPIRLNDNRLCWFLDYKYPIYDDNGTKYLQVLSHEIVNPQWIDTTNKLREYDFKRYNTQHYLIDKSTPEKLTKQEMKVLFYLLRSYSAKRIAKILNISNRTVESHIINIKYKFNCRTKSELIEFSIDQGFIHIIPGNLFV